MFSALMENVDNLKKQISNISRVIETQIKRNFRSKNSVIKKALSGFISRHDTVEERIRDHEDRSIEILQTKMQREEKNGRCGGGWLERIDI